MKWIVMSVDKAAGTVELIAESPTAQKLTLYGKTGYKNAETVLNDIGAIYGYGEGATGGRSITIEDYLNHLEDYTPKEDSETYTYTSGTFINDDGTEVTATEDNPVTMSYTASTAEKCTNRYFDHGSDNHDNAAELSVRSGMFYFASRCLCMGYSGCNYNIRVSAGGYDVTDRLLYASDGFESGGSYDGTGFSVMPVVTLKANIKTSGQDENGAWNLVIE